MAADVELVALLRLRDYASAWRAIGCSCGGCGQCDARNLTPDDADAIADEIEALRAEVERLRQLVNGGRGPLPAGAVAWLDMSPGEASLAFDKKSDSNRANKRRLMELFHRVSAGYYPLYLEPQADRSERLAEALRDARDRMLGQVKWVACDCGCDRDKPADAVSVAWLRASALLRDQENDDA